MAKPIPQIPRRIRKRADMLPTMRQQLSELLASHADGVDLALCRTTIAEIMAAAGLDPRPSVFDDMRIWGLDVVAGASPIQHGPRRMVARVRKASASMGDERTQLDATGWRRLEGLHDGLLGIRVERLVEWSVDQQTWTRFSPGQARVLGEIELAELRLLHARMDTDVPTPEELAQIRERALAQVGNRPRYSYVRWAEREPDDDSYYVIILVATDNDRDWPVLPGPNLPPVVSFAQLQELAAVSPDTLVVDTQGQTKRQVLAGFTEARAAGNGARHTGQMTAAEAVGAASAGPGEGEYMVLRDMVREDMDWLWVGVERGRRLRGQPTPRAAPTAVPDSGTLGRQDARIYWLAMLKRHGGRMTWNVLTRMVRETKTDFPRHGECPVCHRWWLHGCKTCKGAKRADLPCPAFTACATCYCSLDFGPDAGPFVGDIPRIEDEIRLHRDAQRKRRTRAQDASGG